MKKLQELKDLQEKLNELQGELKGKKEEFEVSVSDLTSSIKSITEDIVLVKEELTQDAIVIYEETGSKKLDGGLGIREYTKYVYDEDVVKKWCFDKQLCIDVNFKAFEKLASTTDLDFVSRKKEITVTFPKEIKL